MLVFEIISKTVLLTFLLSDFYPLLVECLAIRREQQQRTNPTGEIALLHDCFYAQTLWFPRLRVALALLHCGGPTKSGSLT